MGMTSEQASDASTVSAKLEPGRPECVTGTFGVHISSHDGTTVQWSRSEWVGGVLCVKLAAPAAPVVRPNSGLGIPTRGGPLCSDADHHPLCGLNPCRPGRPPTQEELDAAIKQIQDVFDQDNQEGYAA